MEEKKRLIITVVIVVLANLALLGGLIYQLYVLGVPPLEGEESYSTKINQLDQRIKALTDIRDKQLPAAEERLASLQQNAEIAEQRRPREVKVDRVLEFFRTKAEEAGVALDTYERVENRKTSGRRGRKQVDPTEKFVYDLELYGNYDQLALFVTYMEMFETRGPDGLPRRRFFAVQDIEIAAQDSGIHETKDHYMELRLVTYAYKEPAAGRRR